MWHLSYRPEVEEGIVDAVTWYDEKRLALGDELLFEYLAAIQRIRDNPLLFAKCGLVNTGAKSILAKISPQFDLDAC